MQNSENKKQESNRTYNKICYFAFFYLFYREIAVAGTAALF